MICKIALKNWTSKMRRDVSLREWAVPVPVVPSEALCGDSEDQDHYALIAEEDHREEGTQSAMCNATTAVAMGIWQLNASQTILAALPIAKWFARPVVPMRGTI